jgi:hypothetical protein
MYLNWNWFKSMIDALQKERITKERFIREWGNAQKALRGLGKNESRKN